MSDHNPPNMHDSNNGGTGVGGTGVPPVSPARGEPGGDRLDALLAAWHAANADRARAGRDRLLAAISAAPVDQPESVPPVRVHERARSVPAVPVRRHWMRRFLMNRYSPVAAALITMLVVGVMLLPSPATAVAQVTSRMAPDAGRLDALDTDGNVLGPCALKYTDVQAEVSGCLLRVNVKQVYSNPFSDKIETVYTFPLSHKAAVDRMTMTIGSRVVQGEVKERELARQIYEAARDAGRIASLLEQERPNIFTQSVANIEPKAEIIIEISYVELLEPVNGLYSFVFPTTVGPRYIPGDTTLKLDDVPVTPGQQPMPAGIRPRRGLVLSAPGKISMLPDSPSGTPVTPDWLQRVLNNPNPRTPHGGATPVRPDASYTQPEVIATFRADYPDGSAEYGSLRSDGVGEVGGRWFHVVLPQPGSTSQPSAAPNPGSPFSAPTNQVPDADKITPMPTRPDMRAGHDISISVNLDTGGPGLSALSSPSHTVTGGGSAGSPRASVELAKANEIPNKDFVLTWSTAGSGIQEGVFTHSGVHGNFFSIILEPPARVEPDQIVPRELVFVLDTSGSMNGWPIEKSKELMTKAIAQMRPTDTFNIITFAGSTRVLWKSPRPASEKNIAEAQAFVGGQQGAGGTEMMTAINAALEQTPIKVGAKVGGGRAAVRPLRTVVFLTDAFVGNEMAIVDAIKKHRGTTRVFSLGVGNSVNRYLIDSMARAGGGESETVLLDQDADAAVARLTRRIQSPVLTDIELEFSSDLAVTDILPADDQGHLPDLYDLRPLVLTGRYTAAGAGTLTVRGNTGAGPYERVINVTLPLIGQGSDAIATLWARAKVDEVTGRDLQALQEGRFPAELKGEVVQLGETFQIMTPFTSFVAVDKLSVTVNGKPRLVHIPIELPAGTAWKGFFGGAGVGERADNGIDEDEMSAAGEKLGMLESGEASRMGRMRANRASSLREESKAKGEKGDPTLAVKGTSAGFGVVQSPPPPPSAQPAPAPSTPGAPASAAAPSQPRRQSGADARTRVPPTAPPAGKPGGQVNAPASAGPGGTHGGGRGAAPGPAKESARRALDSVTGRPAAPAEGKKDAGDKTGYPSAPQIDLEGATPMLGDIPLVGHIFTSGANSIPPVFTPIGGQGAYEGAIPVDESVLKPLADLLTAQPLTPEQRRLIGVAPDASVRDQLASGRVPVAHLVKAAAGLSPDAAAVKSAGVALKALCGENPAIVELLGIAPLLDAKDASATLRVKALTDEASARLSALYRGLKLAQTLDRQLLEDFTQLSVDKAPSSHEFPVVVLISSGDKATTDAVREAGLVTDHVDAAQRVIIGRITLAKLEKVALLESVLRIERDR